MLVSVFVFYPRVDRPILPHICTLKKSVAKCAVQLFGLGHDAATMVSQREAAGQQ